MAARDSVSVSDHHRVSAQIVFIRAGESQSGAEEQIQQRLNIRKGPNNYSHQLCENLSEKIAFYSLIPTNLIILLQRFKCYCALFYVFL